MQINRIIYIAFFTLILLICVSGDCRRDKDDCHHRLWIRNNTRQAIYFGYSFDSTLSRLDYNPGVSPETFKGDGNSVKGHYRIDCYESELVYTIFDKLYIFLFDASIIETTSWNTIRQNRLLLKRYDLTKPQLDSCNWIVTWP